MAKTKINAGQIVGTAGQPGASEVVKLNSNADVASGLRNLTASAGVVASYFKGDGSALTNINIENLDAAGASGSIQFRDSDGEFAGNVGLSYFNGATKELQLSGTFWANGLVSGSSLNVGGGDFTVSDAGAVVAASLNNSSGGITNAGAISGGSTLALSGLASVASISMDDGSTLGPDSVADLWTFNADGDTTQKDGAYDFDLASHDGTNGLKLGGVLVTSTAAELNYVDVTTIGTAQASKAVVLDAQKDITGFNSLTSQALTASAGITAGAAVTAGTSFIIGSADLNEADLEKLDGITNGTAAASKAVVLDAQKDITGFNSLTSQALTASAGITAGAAVTAGTSFIIGSADLNEADLEKLDGITDGTGAANKALVLDGNADVTAGLRSVTGSGDAFFANVRVTTALRAAQVAATSGAEIAGLNYAATGAPKVTDAVGGNGIVPSSGVLNLEWYKESFTSSSMTFVDGTNGYGTASLSATPLSGAMAGGAYGGGVMVYLNGVLQRSGSGVANVAGELEDNTAKDICFYSSGSASATTVCFNTAIDSDDYIEIVYLKA